jgi:hypothetical protein
MVTANAMCEDDLQYTVSFRQVRRIEREDAPPAGRFETTSSARFARESRYRRESGGARRGIQLRGTSRARF